jgi:large subunit ribosomal protein L25
MSASFELHADPRDDMGKGASRRLRRENKVPAILYGGGKPPRSLSLVQKELLKSLDNEAFYSHILSIHIGDQSEQAVLRDMQRHPSKPSVLHVDLQRVQARELLRMSVPLHFVGEDDCPGVKLEGGVVTHNAMDVEVECYPKDLPEYIEIDASGLRIGDSVHLSEIKMPDGVRLVDLVNFDKLDEDERNEVDQQLIAVQPPAVEVEAEEEEAEVVAPAAEAEKPAKEAGTSED